MGPLLPNNPDAAPATLTSEHSEKGPDACEEELEAGMYDRIGYRTGKEREAHPPTQSYSKLVTNLDERLHAKGETPPLSSS